MSETVYTIMLTEEELSSLRVTVKAFGDVFAGFQSLDDVDVLPVDDAAIVFTVHRHLLAKLDAAKPVDTSAAEVRHE